MIDASQICFTQPEEDLCTQEYEEVDIPPTPPPPDLPREAACALASECVLIDATGLASLLADGLPVTLKLKSLMDKEPETWPLARASASATILTPPQRRKEEDAKSLEEDEIGERQSKKRKLVEEFSSFLEESSNDAVVFTEKAVSDPCQLCLILDVMYRQAKDLRINFYELKKQIKFYSERLEVLEEESNCK